MHNGPSISFFLPKDQMINDAHVVYQRLNQKAGEPAFVIQEPVKPPLGLRIRAAFGDQVAKDKITLFLAEKGLNPNIKPVPVRQALMASLKGVMDADEAKVLLSRAISQRRPGQGVVASAVECYRHAAGQDYGKRIDDFVSKGGLSRLMAESGLGHLPAGSARAGLIEREFRANARALQGQGDFNPIASAARQAIMEFKLLGESAPVKGLVQAFEASRAKDKMGDPVHAYDFSRVVLDDWTASVRADTEPSTHVILEKVCARAIGREHLVSGTQPDPARVAQELLAYAQAPVAHHNEILAMHQVPRLMQRHGIPVNSSSAQVLRDVAAICAQASPTHTTQLEKGGRELQQRLQPLEHLLEKLDARLTARADIVPGEGKAIVMQQLITALGEKAVTANGGQLAVATDQQIDYAIASYGAERGMVTAWVDKEIGFHPEGLALRPSLDPDARFLAHAPTTLLERNLQFQGKLIPLATQSEQGQLPDINPLKNAVAEYLQAEMDGMDRPDFAQALRRCEGAITEFINHHFRGVAPAVSANPQPSRSTKTVHGVSVNSDRVARERLAKTDAIERRAFASKKSRADEQHKPQPAAIQQGDIVDKSK